MLDWRDYIRPRSARSLSGCVEDGRLRLDGQRVTATVLDIYALRLIEWALSTRQSLVLCTPDPFDALAALAAAAVHIWRMTELHRQFGGAPRTDYKVAVVTSQYRLRTIYRRLGVLDAKLFEAAPAAIRTSTGDVSVLGRPGNSRDWSTIFVPRPSDLRRLRNVDLAVIELPVFDTADALDAGIPKIFIGHSPADPFLVQLARTLPTFGWDCEDLRRITPLRATDGPALVQVSERLERVAKGVICLPIAVPAQSVSENAALFWSDIGLLMRAARASLFAREFANASLALFQDLMHLAMPTARHDSLSEIPLAVRLRQLGRYESQAKGDVRDLYLPMVTAELRGLLDAIGGESPKTRALLAVLRDHVDRRQNIMLVARTAPLARTLQTYLTTFPELAPVRVTSLGALSEESPSDIAILTGLAPSWARHVYATGIAREMFVLAYDVAAPLRSVADGFIECSHVASTVAYQKEFASWIARSTLKQTCWEKLSGETLGDNRDDAAEPSVDKSNVQIARLPEAPDVPPGLWDASTRMPALASDGILAGLINVSRDDDDRPSVVYGLRVEFTDGRWVILDNSATATRFRPASATLDVEYDVKRIRPGDRLVFLDGDAKKDLLAKVLEVAGEVPELAVAAAWVEHWRNALRRAYRQFGTYEAFADSMRDLGCGLETQTIRLWVIGITIGPADRNDVRRVGELLDDTALRDHHSAVYSGIAAFRGAHSKLMARVGGLAVHYGSAAVAGRVDDDEVIDERSGLTAGDFRDCIDILEVNRVSEVGSVPYVITGRLREKEEFLE